MFCLLYDDMIFLQPPLSLTLQSPIKNGHARMEEGEGLVSRLASLYCPGGPIHELLLLLFSGQRRLLLLAKP